ncbi:glycosyltransferase involved in cell wall biosynthesis [Microvirga lupini]|uniref:Glycosyltransferase involved in cell wall biosynthesis n=1 Tax=Microvirga lupini TaxID=420324 RepID=A0A7W4VRH5_9HYPH|nr:glycosyltransferase [Microvirga lupini]MBB3021691.1 glycosyltransferase involved in cell wall biosynthesis [Microvirga lupini]
MRVLAITNMYPSAERPGWGSFVRSQVESLRNAGVDVDVLVIEGYRSKLEYLKAISRMRRMLRECRYDLIHAHYGLSGLVARFQFSIPIIVSFCGDDLYGHSDPKGRARLSSLPFAWIHRQLSRFVDASVVKSKAMNALLPRPNATVISNGVDMEMFRPLEKQACREELSLDPDRTYILFPYAPDRPRKNFSALKEAVDGLRAQSPERLIEILTIAGEPQHRIPLYMNAADVLVLPSFWEGSPNAVKEAMACNMKVVASDVGDVRERLDGVPGTAICGTDPTSIAAAISTALDDNRDGSRREAVAELDIGRVADQVIAVYSAVLRRARKDRGVLMIVENLPVPFDRRVWQEAKALTAAGWNVSVICPKRGKYTASRETIDGIDIYRHPLPEAQSAIGYPLEYGIAFFWQLFLATCIYMMRGYKVIHACNPPDLIFLVAAPFKLLGVKFIFDHHDLCPELAVSKFGPGRKHAVIQRALRILERATFRLADASIATNESYKSIAIRRGGMHPDRVHVVRSAPDLKLWRPMDPDPLLRTGAAHLVGYVGVMGPQEGLSNLLTSIEHIIHKLDRRDIRFILVGDGSELQALKSEARARRIDPWVEFTGRVSDQDLIRILSSCDVCVNPDLATPFNDLSSMNKIVEYMALGKPIVQVDLAEGRFTAGEAAIGAAPDDPVDFAEKIVALLADEGTIEKMALAARQRVADTLSWDRQVPHLLACYAQVASQENQTRRYTWNRRDRMSTKLSTTNALEDDHG